MYCYPCCVNYFIYGLLMVSGVIGICKTSRPNLRVYLGFSVCPLRFSFHFVWYYFSIYSQIRFVILKTSTDVKWRKGTEKDKTETKTCLFLSKRGTFPGRKERFYLVPNITKSYK